jgi:UDP-N-acetylmuramyl pentapeptide phosphotransferase/UDP-N-acetylglucosamine-1-phosphate transferase
MTSLQVFASPEDMYGMYDKDGKHRKMTEKVEQIIHRSEELKKEEQNKKISIMIVSLVIALIPLCIVGGDVIRKQTWRTNSRGTRQALGTALAGGVALFAFNYGWLYLKYLQEEVFKWVLSIAFIILLIGTGIYLARNNK